MVEASKVTIICVTYNAEQFISVTLENIKAQTFLDYELLVIDGASNDNTLEIIKAANINNIRIYSEQDFGIYDAMNKGINYCTTEWFIFMNAGDIFASKYTLENIFYNIKKGSLIVYGDTLEKNSDKKIRSPKYISKYYFFSHTICHQSVLINKKVCEEIGFHNLNYKIIADREFFYRAALNKIKFQKINMNISVWDPIGYSSKNKINYFSEEKRFRKNFSILTLPIIFLLNKTIYV